MSDPAPFAEPADVVFGAPPVIDYYAARQAPPAAPVAETERIESIDVLRGFALMGILLVNIQFMAMPMHKVDSIRWQDLPALDGVARFIVQVFFELKFITLFSFLFGAGLAIQMDRLQRSGRAFVPVYVRRLLVLLGFGIFHGVLLWYGDILAVYAVLGFAALLFRNCRPRTLILWAAGLFVVPLIGTLGLAALDPTADWTSSSWGAMAESSSIASSQTATATTTVSTDLASAMTRRICAFLDDESRIYRTGSFGEMVALRTCYFIATNLTAFPFLYLWRCLALFLLGMAAVKSGILTSGSLGRSPRWILAAMAFALGLILELFADRQLSHDAVRAASVSRAYVLTYVGSLALSTAYALTVFALGGRANLNWLVRPVGAMGRMALSNYLMHSLFGGLIFYNYGLGLFGTMGSAALFGIACAILATQLILSPIWLRHFQFGPVEWLWRMATYGKVQPMRRTVG